jgi:hypothetical protein
MKIPSTLARVLQVLGAGVCLVGSASALTINFNTGNSCFAANFGGTACSLTPGAVQYSNAEGDIATLTFGQATGTASDPSNTVDTDIGYGVFQLSYAPMGSGTQLVNFGPTSFLLNIQETGPFSIAFQTIMVTVAAQDGGGNNVSGQVGPNTTNLDLTFAPVSVNYTATTFSIVPAVQLLVDPTINMGNITIQGHLTASVPEPSAWLLLGTGLLTITVLSRKKLILQRISKS